MLGEQLVMKTQKVGDLCGLRGCGMKQELSRREELPKSRAEGELLSCRDLPRI